MVLYGLSCMIDSQNERRNGRKKRHSCKPLPSKSASLCKLNFLSLAGCSVAVSDASHCKHRLAFLFDAIRYSAQIACLSCRISIEGKGQLELGSEF